MLDSSGQITINERSPSHRFHRFVDEKVRNWMKGNELVNDAAEYEVAFFNEEVIGEVSCLVVIHSGATHWRSWEAASNPQLALRRSLEHLHVDSDSTSQVKH
jgi:hypothetical protein